MLFGAIGETRELFMMMGTVVLAIWIIHRIQKATGTGYE